MRRLLLVDDDLNVLHALQRSLKQCRFASELRVEIFSDPLQALERAREVEFDVAVSDYQMPQMDGITFLQRFRPLQPDTVRLVLSASTEFETVKRAINEAEVFRYIPKPWDLSELQEIITLALARRDELDATRIQTGELTAQQLAMRRLEAEEGGITQVKWGADGSVHLE